MFRSLAAAVGAFALLALLAGPGPAAAGEPRAKGIANGDRITEFSSAHRRSHRPRYAYGRYAAANPRPCYYYPYRGYEYPYHYYYRPYLCYGAPFEVPLNAPWWRGYRYAF
jgi:hypothetical protein